MKTFKFEYVVCSKRVSYVYAEDLDKAKEKLDNFLEKEGIEKIEEHYVETLNEYGLGIDYGSIQEVPDIVEDYNPEED